jgi:hypothetical protein
MKLQGIKIELGKVQDIEELYQKGKSLIDEANLEKAKLKSKYSNALIILELNVDGQVQNALKAAKELGVDEISQQLMEINSKAKKLANEYKSLYKALS